MKDTNPFSISCIQEFGYLVVANTQLTILGISESALVWSGENPNEILGSPLEVFIHKIFHISNYSFLKIIDELVEHKIPRQIITKKIDNKLYYFKLGLQNELLYIEWEEQQKKHILSSKMNELGFLFDHSYPNDWKFVCSALNRLLNFDRVFVLQVLETGRSKVIAEHTANGRLLFHKKEFSENFMPSTVIPYYASESYRYIPDFSTLAQKFFSIDPALDILSSQLVCPPELHELYLKSIGVNAALFFSLYMDGQFWGLVIAHNEKPKKVDLQKRKLCSFIIQNTMSKYENLIKQGLLDFNHQIAQTEVALKEKLIASKTVNCAMVNGMNLLMDMAKAEGLAIYHQGDLFFHGLCPTTKQFYEIVHYIQKITDKTIFKDYNFKLNHGKHISSNLPFAGLMSYMIGKDKDHYLVWFRKETISTMTQMEVRLNHTLSSSTKVLTHNSIHIWEKSIRDSAIPWDESDLNFVECLHRIINESIIHKTKERSLLTEELLAMNNELEMFTFTLSHDLKNPLSILKMGLQFLEVTGHTLPVEKRLHWYKNLLGSILNIEDIINNIVKVSQNKTTALAKDPVPMSYTIRKLSREMTMLHQTEQCQFHFGTLFPLWGEKSALYQIFLNLIGNAVKYSSSKQKPHIWIDSVQNGKEVCYSIKDNGIGIPPNSLPHVFDMFSRAQNAQHFGGSGIGLSLVKRIMDRLGGKIEIISQEAEGTEIKLYFPSVSDFPPSMLLEN